MTSQPIKHNLGAQVSITTYHAATRQIIAWAKNSESRTVCVANVHLVMDAHEEPVSRGVINKADMAVLDRKFIC